MLRTFFFGLLISSTTAFAGAAGFEVSTTEVKSNNGDFTVVSFQGSLLENSGSKLVEALNAAKTQRIVLELNSDGGRLKEAQAIQAGMDALKAQGKSIETFVANGSTCQSACTILFFYADTRIAAETAAFMFHSVQYEAFRGVVERFQTNALVDYYIKRGLSPQWVKEREQEMVFTGVNEKWISGKDAVAQKIGLVTQLVSSVVTHDPAPIDPQIRSR
jgi:ATP-dependent protease ClpP protease subunit